MYFLRKGVNLLLIGKISADAASLLIAVLTDVFPGAGLFLTLPGGKGT